MAKEIELKLRLGVPEEREKIIADKKLQALAEKDSICVERLTTVYYDTVDYKLMKAGLAYRIRYQEAEGWIATIKSEGSSAGALHERPEWSFIVEDAQPNLRVFKDCPFWENVQDIVKYKLYEVVKTEFERRSMNLVLEDGTVVEFAADRGEVITPLGREMIDEVELELKKGNLQQLLRLGDELCAEYTLIPEQRSKYHRGLILAGLIKTKMV